MHEFGRAFVVVDYHNLYATLKARLPALGGPEAAIVALIDSVRDMLRRTRGIEFGPARAFSDFTELGEQAYYVQRDLLLHGVEPRFVPIGLDRSVMDMRLCVDVMDAARDAAWTACVLVTADREFLPLVQALSDMGKGIILVSLKRGLSAELTEHLPGGTHVDGWALLSESDPELGEPSDDDAPAARFEPVDTFPYDIDRDALEVIVRHFGQYQEIYLTPLLRKLSDELGHHVGHDPKGLIGDLEACGAVRLEKRRGSRYDFTVLLLNPDHPEVVRVREETATHPLEDPDYGEREYDEPEQNGREGSWDEVEWRHVAERN